MVRQFVDDEVISAAIEKYADMVRRICFLYLRNSADVEDVFQEVFLKYFQHYTSLNDEEHHKAWLCRVAINKCKDLRKSFWRRKVLSIEEMEGFDIPYETPEQSELMDAVLKLPPNLKELVYLHYYEGFPVPQIAEMLHKNPNTVYTQIRRARELLKKKAEGI